MPENSTAMMAQHWRTPDHSFLRQRREMVSLSVLSCAVLGRVALFQVGILKHLPDPPIPRFDSDAVNGSAEAYRLLRTPDALPGELCSESMSLPAWDWRIAGKPRNGFLW